MYYRRVFASFGRGSVLYEPMLLSHPECIYVGDGVTIRQGVRLEGVILDSANPPVLRIGNNVNIEQDVQIVFIGNVIIHDNVSITARCTLLSGTHPFFDIHSPIKIGDRLAGADSIIEIGAGSFLGVASVVTTNVRIGKHVIVGSNSVVKKSIPDYSVVDGNPADVIMHYEKERQRWALVK